MPQANALVHCDFCGGEHPDHSWTIHDLAEQAEHSVLTDSDLIAIYGVVLAELRERGFYAKTRRFSHA